MKVVVCVVLASIFVNTVKALKSKQVNLALETVLNFDKKDRTTDLAVIDKVQNFLEQIKDAMRLGNARRNTKQDVTLTDFILEAARILKEFDDIALEDAYVILNEESRRYINKESKLQDLFDSNDMRRFVSDQLDEAKEMPAFLLRRSLDSVINLIESQNKTGYKNDLLDIGNTLYDGASNKFMVALRNLDKVRRSAGEDDLESLLRDMLRTLVYDHYSNLNHHVRDELINMVKHYWRAFEPKLKVVDRHGEKRHRYRVNSPTERTRISKSRINKDKSYKSDKRDIKNTHKKHEVFLSKHELKKLIKNTEEDKPNRFSVHKGNIKPYRNSEAKKVHNKQNLGRIKPSTHLHRGKGKKHHRTEDRESITQSDLSASSEPEVLMGGQIIRDTHFRADSSSRQVSESSSAEKDSSTEEIVLQHSNIVDVGLSRKTPGRINITFVSSETHKTEEENSYESISIENKVMRRGNVNDTLVTNVDLLNVNLLIKKIEREIEDVKDQFEHVKNLAKTGISKNNESSLTESAKNLTVAETPSKDNGFAFRAVGDSDDNSYSEIEIDSKIEVTNSTSTATTDTIDANTVNESKISDVVENTPESINVINNTNPEKSIEREIGDTNQTHDANKANDLKVITDIQNDPKFSENGKDKYKNEDQENAILTESNLNNTATTLEDVPMDV